MLLENVVIGHSMESALFAYVNDFYHIQSSNFYPLFFGESRGFSLFGTSNKKQIWTKIKIMLGVNVVNQKLNHFVMEVMKKLIISL